MTAAVAGQPILKYFYFSFWLQRPSATDTMHCFLHCSYLSIGCWQVGRWLLWDQILVLVTIAVGHIASLLARAFKSVFLFNVTLNKQAVCHESLFTTKTYTLVWQERDTCPMALCCLRLHFQDLGLSKENGGNFIPLAGAAGPLKTALKCLRVYLQKLQDRPPCLQVLSWITRD